jgi:hypothetical protein
MATTTTSGQFSLNTNDLLKGLLLAVLTPVVTIVIDTLNQGSLTFDWKHIGVTALSALLAYLIKNFLAPAQIVLHSPTDTEVKAVKQGTAKASIVRKSAS